MSATRRPGIHALRQARLAGADDGFTLIEMSVVVILLGLVTAVLFNFMNNTVLLTRRGERDLQSEQNMSLALRTVTEDLRGASTMYSCGAGYSLKWCVSFDVPRATQQGLSCPQRTVTYNMNLTAKTVYETDIEYPTAACSPTTTKFNSRPVLESLANGTSDYFLTWYDSTGASFDPDVTPAAIQTAASIKALVKVTYGVPGAPSLQLYSVAALRNHRT
jgi:prepilin-type N-terminal cleavage/methylation domain-containing protein